MSMGRCKSSRYLPDFWKRAARLDRTRVSERFALLQEMTEHGLPFRQPYAKTRLESRFLPAVTGVCWLCRISPAVHWRHVIMICRGGHNGNDNRVPICLDCHAAIHPWMKDEPWQRPVKRHPLPQPSKPRRGPAIVSIAAPRLRRAQNAQQTARFAVCSTNPHSSENTA